MHRRLPAVLGAVLLLLASSLPAIAFQDATPTSALTDLGLPVLEVTATSTGYEGLPEELPAGRYLVRVTAPADIEYGGGLAFLQAVGVSTDELLGIAGGGAPPGDGPATPMAEADGTPVVDDEMMGAPPPFVFESLFAGGTFALAGQTAEVVLDLTPGEWIAWGDDPSAPQAPVVVTVTGEMPADLPEPASSATLTMSEYTIDVTAGALQAGPQVVKVDNIGQQPHYVFVAKAPDGTTLEQVAEVLEAEAAAGMSGTPPAYTGLNPEEDLVDVAATGTQSTGTSLWIPMTLEPGSYVLICFFPDIGDGMPHAFHGMYNVVEVSE